MGRSKGMLHNNAREVVKELHSHAHEGSATQTEVALGKSNIEKKSVPEEPLPIINDNCYLMMTDVMFS